METRVDQIADRIYRISTCLPEVAPGGFTFNQFLVDAEEPLLYHTGMRQLGPRTLAMMHGSSYSGGCPALLRSLADGYEQHSRTDPSLIPAQPVPVHAEAVS